MIGLSQEDADMLFFMHKKRSSTTELDLPDMGGKLIVDLESFDGKENFILDIYKGRVQFERVTFQNRARSTVLLARLDFGSLTETPTGRRSASQESPHFSLRGL
ncbi:DUF6978 family protein [Siccirubricoccus phaeus]|uniref:DUF6978 family protein n=1 Tax=Siccirubricoccus phaeus TaxID=2595053 RepID=UPI0038B60341